MKRKRNTKRMAVPVILGLTVLYLVMMTLATYLVKQKFSEQFDDVYQRQKENFCQFLYQESISAEEAVQGIAMALAPERPYQQFAAVVYDTDGKKIAESQAMLTALEGSPQYPADEYLSREQQKDLAQYVLEIVRQNRTSKPWKYRFIVLTAKDAKELARIVVQEIEWKESQQEAVDRREWESDPITGICYSWGNGEKHYVQVGSRTVWEWKNPGISEQAELQPYELSVYQLFTQIFYGIEAWEAYCDNEFLHDFPETVDLKASDPLPNHYIIQNKRGVRQMIGGETVMLEQPSENSPAYFIYASEAHPWQAAVDYMGDAYLGSIPILAACMAAVLFWMYRIEKTRARLEESRRCFTNAMAHELKTPLGIIRGFAENLVEDTVAEKRGYYLEQIISQTEEMDRLVAQMLYVSKLDENPPEGAAENLNLAVLFREQIRKFEVQTDQKQIQVSIRETGEFRIQGERSLLEKAVWNVLSNAVFWCREGGTISVCITPRKCTVENTGPQIAPEHLPHIFEMMYRGDDARTQDCGEKHLGMGLYLTQRILRMYRRNITAENTEHGVLVRIT